jgi:hypothetical protein
MEEANSLAITLAFKSLTIMSNKQHILLLPFSYCSLLTTLVVAGIGHLAYYLLALWR